MTLTGSVTRAAAGAQGFDTDTVVSGQQAQQLRAAGFKFCLRYLSRAEGESSADLTPAEAGRILDAGLALMPIQHVARRGWVPAADLGTTYGKAAAANATAVGFPQGVNVWLDLEGVLGSVLSEEVIRYCNAWFFAPDASFFTLSKKEGDSRIFPGLKTARFDTARARMTRRSEQMCLTTTEEVRPDAGRATRFSASAQSIGVLTTCRARGTRFGVAQDARG